MEGLGLFARDAIKADTFLCEYVGELIRRPLEDAREQQWQAQGRANYLFRRDKEWVIDATKRVRAAAGFRGTCMSWWFRLACPADCWAGGWGPCFGLHGDWLLGMRLLCLCCAGVCYAAAARGRCRASMRAGQALVLPSPDWEHCLWAAMVTTCGVLQGNHARYINHSCDGNCQSFTVTSKNNTRIIICAKRDIQPGEELCYDYKVPPSLTKVLSRSAVLHVDCLPCSYSALLIFDLAEFTTDDTYKLACVSAAV